MLQLDGPFYDFIMNRKPPSYESVNAHQRLVHADREKPLRLRPRRCKHSAQTKYVSGRTQSPRNEHETTRATHQDLEDMVRELWKRVQYLEGYIFQGSITELSVLHESMDDLYSQYEPYAVSQTSRSLIRVEGEGERSPPSSNMKELACCWWGTPNAQVMTTTDKYLEMMKTVKLSQMTCKNRC
ncbi:hypothetical protein GQ600_2800 [Phytophthora cactorum]|nr:hypothetical protein GQ600_2800 [Phytophthora cactorum]